MEQAFEASSADGEANRPSIPARVSPVDLATTDSLISGENAPQTPLVRNGSFYTDDSAVSRPTLNNASSVSEDYLQYLSRPHHIEKCFLVDRKKMEKLITDGGPGNESAEEFFLRVQSSTGTLVLWPSRLKIGARSKKDPQVKVVGLAANIQQARDLILHDLDAKSTRVTLKIDIAFSEHSHVIGKEGVNIKKVHNETKCHIHFPDSNRSTHGGEKSSQVSVTGQAANVELARRKIRELLPLVVTFSLPLPSEVDQNAPEIQQISFHYNVAIHLKPQHQLYNLLVVVRGTVKHMAGVQLAVTSLMEFFTGDIHTVPAVSVQLDIAAQHHRTLIGSGGGNIRKIMTETNTTVQFPDPLSRYRSNQVLVTGTMESAFKAREQLLGCLPVVLMFDVHESDSNMLCSSLIGDLMQQLDLFISVKPKKGQLQSVIIKSIEQNMHCMYRARTHLLNCSYQPNLMQPGTMSTSLTSSPSVSPHPMSACSSPHTRSPSPIQSNLLPQNGPIPTHPPLLKDTPSKVTISMELTPDKLPEANPTVAENQEQRRVSFQTDLTSKLNKNNHRDRNRTPSPTATPDRTSPTEVHPLASSLAGQKSKPPVRLTPRLFVDYENKREKAKQAMRAPVEPSEPRYPTTAWSGDFLSMSMPAGPPRGQLGQRMAFKKGGSKSFLGPLSPSSSPQGLSAVNQSSYRALAHQASQDRIKPLPLQAEQDTFRGVIDLPGLLHQLNLEHYEDCFQREEVDLATFLTMTEEDLKEVGVTTVGARRKLSLAISEINQYQQGKASVASLPHSSASLSHAHFRSGSVVLCPERMGGIMRRSASLNRDTNKFSLSGRF